MDLAVFDVFNPGGDRLASGLTPYDSRDERICLYNKVLSAGIGKVVAVDGVGAVPRERYLGDLGRMASDGLTRVIFPKQFAFECLQSGKDGGTVESGSKSGWTEDKNRSTLRGNRIPKSEIVSSEQA